MIDSVRHLSVWFSTPRRRALASVGILVLLVHLSSVLLFPGGELQPDERRYIQIAENLLTAKTFGVEPGVPFSLNAPLYPFFIACLLAIGGHSLVLVRVAQAIIGTINSITTFGLVRTLFPQRPVIAWFSMLSVGLYPVFFLWEGLILTETIYVLIAQLCCWWWVRSVQSPTRTNIVLVGFGFGLSMLTRETLCFFIPAAVFAALLIIRQQKLRYAALFTVIYMLMLTPWALRNLKVFNHLFFTTRTAYLTRSLTGHGYLDPYYQEWEEETVEMGISPKDLDMNDLAYTPVRYVRSLSFARREPTLYMRIIIARFLELWGHPNGLNRLPESLRLPYQIGHGVILLLAIGGLWTAIKMRHWPLLGWCLVLPYITVLSIYTNPNPRYTLPFVPLIFVLAILQIDSILQFFWCQYIPLGKTVNKHKT